MKTHLQVGDLIMVPGRLGTQHAGIFAGASGVIHGSKDDQIVLKDSLERFCGGFEPKVVKRAKPGKGDEVVRRAAELIGKPYNLLTWNCEHLATYAAHGEASSPQLQRGVLVFFAAAGIGLYKYATRGWDGDVGRYRDANGRFRAGW